MADATILPNILLTPLKQGVSAAGGTLEVLLRVQAPPQPAGAATSRSPLRLSLVVDRSGSMDGQPLDEALRCVGHIVDRLRADDQVAVVLYDDQVRVAVPLQPAANKSAIHAAIAGVQSGGSTALFDGWQAGAKQLEGGQAGTISRVLLLSDGQANHGPSTLDEIKPHCEAALARGVGTTTVGLGRAFNEDLMIGMARAGGGRQYYGQTAEDLHDSFDEELSLLEALFLRMLRAKALPAQDVIVEAMNAGAPGPDGWLAMSDLAWGAESWLLLRLHVPAQAASGGVARTLLSVNIQAVTKEGAPVEMSSAVLALPVVSAEAFAALPQDETVSKRLQEVQFAQGAAQARAALLDGDVKGAQAMLSHLEARVADHPWLKQSVEQLKLLAMEDVEMAAKEVRYRMSRMTDRIVGVNEAGYTGDETNAVNIPAFLRRKAQEGRGRRK